MNLYQRCYISPFFGKPQRGILSHKLKQCTSHKLLYAVRKSVNPLMQYYVKKDRKQILVSIPAKMHEPWPLYQNNSGNITVDANDGTEK